MSENESPATETPTPTVSDDMLVILPVRNIVLFPGTVLPIGMNREASIAAAQEVVRAERKLGVLLQRDSDKDEVTGDDLHRIGTVASVLRYVTGQDGAHHLVLQGERRFRVLDFQSGLPYLMARVEFLPEQAQSSSEIEALALNLKRLAVEAIGLLPRAPAELANAVQSIESPASLVDLVASFLDVKVVGASAAARDARPQGTSGPGVGAGFTPHRGDEAATADRRADAWCHR